MFLYNDTTTVKRLHLLLQHRLLAIVMLLMCSVTAFHPLVQRRKGFMTLKSSKAMSRKGNHFTENSNAASLTPISQSRLHVIAFDRPSKLKSLEKNWQQLVTTLDWEPNKHSKEVLISKQLVKSQHSINVNTIDTKTTQLDGVVPLDKIILYITTAIDSAVTAISAQLLLYHLTAYHSARLLVQTGNDRIQSIAKQYWWTFPLALCFAPALMHTICQQPISTPNFWKMVNLQFILKHSPDAKMVVQFFVGSNIAYLGAGSFLLHRFPGGRVLKRGLGLWTLSAGLISTIFHTIQAVGDYSVAESLCYIDHGIAGAAVLYFWKTCGAPPMTVKFWSITIAGLAALSLPIHPGYAWLHSTWHFLSAYSAILWAMDGKLKRQQLLLQRIRLSRRVVD
jgi:hypothetical protein